MAGRPNIWLAETITISYSIKIISEAGITLENSGPNLEPQELLWPLNKITTALERPLEELAVRDNRFTVANCRWAASLPDYEAGLSWAVSLVAARYLVAPALAVPVEPFSTYYYLQALHEGKGLVDGLFDGQISGMALLRERLTDIIIRQPAVTALLDPAGQRLQKQIVAAHRQTQARRLKEGAVRVCFVPDRYFPGDPSLKAELAIEAPALAARPGLGALLEAEARLTAVQLTASERAGMVRRLILGGLSRHLEANTAAVAEVIEFQPDNRTAFRQLRAQLRRGIEVIEGPDRKYIDSPLGPEQADAVTRLLFWFNSQPDEAVAVDRVAGLVAEEKLLAGTVGAIKRQACKTLQGLKAQGYYVDEWSLQYHQGLSKSVRLWPSLSCLVNQATAGRLAEILAHAPESEPVGQSLASLVTALRASARLIESLSPRLAAA